MFGAYVFASAGSLERSCFSELTCTLGYMPVYRSDTRHHAHRDQRPRVHESGVCGYLVIGAARAHIQ